MKFRMDEEVEIPKSLLFPAELAVQLLGVKTVYQLVQQGEIVAGQKSYRKGTSNGSTGSDGARALTEAEEAEYARITAEMEGGLSGQQG